MIKFSLQYSQPHNLSPPPSLYPTHPSPPPLPIPLLLLLSPYHSSSPFFIHSPSLPIPLSLSFPFPSVPLFLPPYVFLSSSSPLISPSPYSPSPNPPSPLLSYLFPPFLTLSSSSSPLSSFSSHPSYLVSLSFLYTNPPENPTKEWRIKYTEKNGDLNAYKKQTKEEKEKTSSVKKERK